MKVLKLTLFKKIFLVIFIGFFLVETINVFNKSEEEEREERKYIIKMDFIIMKFFEVYIVTCIYRQTKHNL